MYRVLEVSGVPYRIEYTIEAALYEECIETVTNFMIGMGEASGEKDIKMLIKNMASVPSLTITLLYAGLLEHHGTHKGADGTVTCLEDAKQIATQYIKENKDSESGNFYGLMEILLKQMGDDGFFRQIGLEQMMQATNEQAEPKKPQDHKKKASQISAVK